MKCVRRSLLALMLLLGSGCAFGPKTQPQVESPRSFQEQGAGEGGGGAGY